MTQPDARLEKARDIAARLTQFFFANGQRANLDDNACPTVEVSWTPGTLALVVHFNGGEYCLWDDQNCSDEFLTYESTLDAYYDWVRALAAYGGG